MEVILTGIIAGFIAIFFNYIIGKPGGEFSPYEIFSSYTVLLSKWRLKRAGLFQMFYDDYCQSVFNKDKSTTEGMTRDYHKMLYNAADPLFTWERAVGMCVVCSGFWIALAYGILIVGMDYISLLKIIVVSHVTIRLLSKVL